MARLDIQQMGQRAQRATAVPANSAEDPDFVSAAARALAVLGAFTPEFAQLSNAEIAQRSALPKSTVSRLTYTLARLGWLRLQPESQSYSLGPAASVLARSFMGARGVREVARPHMSALAERFRAPVALTQRDGLDMLYMEYLRGDAPVIVPRGVGSRVFLASSAAGRAWLARAHPVEAGVVREQLAQRMGDEWAACDKRLAQATRDFEQRGFAASFGEVQPEVHSVAVPMVSPIDGSLLVFNLAAPAMLVPRQRFERELGPALAEMVRRIEAELAAPADAA